MWDVVCVQRVRNAHTAQYACTCHTICKQQPCEAAVAAAVAPSSSCCMFHIFILFILSLLFYGCRLSCSASWTFIFTKWIWTSNACVNTISKILLLFVRRHSRDRGNEDKVKTTGHWALRNQQNLICYSSAHSYLCLAVATRNWTRIRWFRSVAIQDTTKQRHTLKR